MTPRGYSNLSEPELEALFLEIILQTGFLGEVLSRAQALNLPNWRVVSGASTD